MGTETKRCNACGAEIDADVTTCPYCDSEVEDGDTPATVCASKQQDSEEVTSSFDYVNAFKNAKPNPYIKPTTDKEKIDAAKYAWAKALKVLMGLSILRFLQTLSEFFTGNLYKDAGTTPELAYEQYGSPLKYLDTFYEIAVIILVVVAVAAIIALNRFKASAGFFVIAGYAGSVIAGVALAVGRTVIFGVNNFRAPVVAGLLGSAAMLIGNTIYFQKSKHIFVN